MKVVHLVWLVPFSWTACEEKSSSNEAELSAISERIVELEAQLAALDGLRGEKGEPGPTGAQGSPGQAGERGATGPQGPGGATGPQGPAGITGPAGATGAAGPIGSMGPAGANGTDGARGAMGEVGPVGPQGERGPPAWGPGEEPAPAYVGELVLNAGPGAPEATLAVRRFSMTTTLPAPSGSGDSSPRADFSPAIFEVELDAAQIPMFQALAIGGVWGSATFTPTPGSGLESVEFTTAGARALRWTTARHDGQHHLIELELAAIAFAIRPEAGQPVSWNRSTNTGTGTLDTAPFSLVSGGAFVGAIHGSRIEWDVTIPTTSVSSGGEGLGRPRLGGLTLFGAPVGAHTAQWFLRMARGVPWEHATAPMPLTALTMDDDLPVSQVELSCGLVPSVLTLRSTADGGLEQDITFRAGVLRLTAYEAGIPTTSTSWSFLMNQSSTTCE